MLESRMQTAEKWFQIHHNWVKMRELDKPGEEEPAAPADPFDELFPVGPNSVYNVGGTA